jgi:hypothetical protein
MSSGVDRIGRWIAGHPAFDAALSDGRPLVAMRSLAENWLRTRSSGSKPLVQTSLTPVGFPQHHGGRLVRFGTSDSVRRLRRAQAVVVEPGGDVVMSDRLLELAAAGVPLVAASPGHPARQAGDDLADLVTTMDRDSMRDVRVRELHSVRLRRCALRSVDPGARAVTVSVVMATRRPEDLPNALAMISRQSHRPVEVLVGLHGADFDTDAIESLRTAETQFFHYDETTNLGEILHDLTRRCGGELVTKWDDDDWYGRHHLEDLVGALRYSGADLVGKAAEFVFLEDLGVTIRRLSLGAETYSSSLAGGTLILRRGMIDRVGGWPLTPRHVDRGLIERVHRCGGVVYRTHGFEYVLRRRTHDHTWTVPTSYFLAQSSEQRSGLDLEFAGLVSDD